MEGLDGLENLNVLNLSGNEIESIGNNYLDWTNLERWDLSNNCIEELSIDDVEKYMPCLKELKLSRLWLI
jgi:Leucine-rich repeat (LRR) protein